MPTTLTKHLMYSLILLLFSTRLCLASVELDDGFLMSQTGTSSVFIRVEELIEIIKNIKLNDGSHVKVDGWQRKGNSYTFKFVAQANSKVELKFEHLLDQKWSTLAVFIDASAVDPAQFIMATTSMPREKTKFDIVNEREILEANNKLEAEAASVMKKDIPLMCSKYGDGREGGFGRPALERTVTITPFSDDKVYFEFLSKMDDKFICNTGKKIGKIISDSYNQGSYELLYEEEDCDIKIDLVKTKMDFEFFRITGMKYRGTCQKYCNGSLVNERKKRDLYPTCDGLPNLEATAKMEKVREKKQKDRWK